MTPRIGTQGWIYDDWVGTLYPPKTKRDDMLKDYAKVFNTVEVDSTFYAIPASSTISSWVNRTPSDFIFSVKLLSDITHKNRLRDSEAILSDFIERLGELGDRLGCILIQLPPDFSPRESTALEKFTRSLPNDLRFAIEFRDPDWITTDTVSLLNQQGLTLALADSKWIDRNLYFPLLDSLAADFAYLRWMGTQELSYFGKVVIDRQKEMAEWAQITARLQDEGRQVFGYFNNYYQGHSPGSCNLFKPLLGLPIIQPESLIIQPSLFD